jgi:hypothetical protein
MATATEAASLNKTECDQLPTWKYKSFIILSVFQHFSLEYVMFYKMVHGMLPASLPFLVTKFQGQSPFPTAFSV